jgi:hypothetical protein
VTTISSGATPSESTTSATPDCSTTTRRGDTVPDAASSTHTVGAPSMEVSAEAGSRIPPPAASSMLPMTVEPSRIAAGGSLSPTRTAKLRVTGLACGDTSRTRPVVLTFGSDVSVTVTTGSRPPAASLIRPGTSNTASRPPWRATRTIIWPAATTSPGSAPTAVTTPSASA